MCWTVSVGVFLYIFLFIQFNPDRSLGLVSQSLRDFQDFSSDHFADVAAWGNLGSSRS